MRSIRLLAMVTFVSCMIDIAHTRRVSALEGAHPGDVVGSFGAPGTFVLLGSGLTASNQMTSSFAARGLDWEVGAHVFLGSRLSIGIAGLGSVSESLTSGGHLTTTRYGLEARLGGLLPLSPWMSFWPQLGLGFIHLGLDYNDLYGGNRASLDGPSSYVTAALDLPVLLHPTRWFFVGLGPKLQVAYADRNELLSIAGHFMFGGAFRLAGG